MYLVYSVTSFAARTGVNCTLKIFKDKSKSKSKQQLYWCKRKVFKISGGREVFQITFQVNYIKRLQFNIYAFKGIKTRIHFFLPHILGVDQNLEVVFFLLLVFIIGKSEKVIY